MESMLSFFFGVLSMLLAIKLFFFFFRNKKKLNLPPSPPSLPIIGHLHLVKKPSHRSLAELSRVHGPVLLLRFGSRPVLLVSSPSAAEECFTTHDVAFANRPRLLAGKYFGYDHSSLAWGPYGPLWRELRRISTVEIFATQRVNRFASLREEEARELARRLHHDNDQNGFKKVTLRPRLFEMMFNMIMRIMMGRRYHDDRETFQEMVEELFRLSSAFNFGDYFPILGWLGLQKLESQQKALSRKIDVLLHGIIEEQRNRRMNERGKEEDPERRTLIDVMLTLQDEDPKYYSERNIMSQILTLVTAGTDTSSVTIEWAMSLLLNHPEAMGKVIAEIKEKLSPNKLVEEADLPHLTYLQAVVNETLRLYPAGPLLVPHESSVDTIVGGFSVPSGTMLLVNAWAMQRDESVWEEAMKFKPERFLPPQSQCSGECKMMPFGTGRRKCPAKVLAVKVVELALTTLLQCFEWERIDGVEVDMTEGPGLSMPRAFPLEVMCRTRKDMIALLS